MSGDWLQHQRIESGPDLNRGLGFECGSDGLAMRGQ